MTKVFLRNEKTNKRYQILKVNKEEGTVRLKGPHAEFDEPFDKERFKRMGYVIEKVDQKDDA